MNTLIGLIPDERHLMTAEQTLQAAGIDQGAMSVLMRPTDVWQRLGGHKKVRVAIRYALFGALIGLALGGLYGVPAGILNCSELGCTMTVSTVLLALITVYLMVGGAFVGAIVGIDRVEQDLYSYVEGVYRGGALLVVETPAHRIHEVARILQQESGLLVHTIEKG
jgi:hypothetical protein